MQNFQDIIDNLPIGMIVIRFKDNDVQSAQCQDLNDTLVTIFDRESKLLRAQLRKDAFCLIHPDDRSYFIDQISRVLQDDIALKNFAQQIRISMPDKSDKWVQVHLASLQRGEDASNLYATVQDITAQIVAEEQYQEQVDYRIALAKTSLASSRINLTDNIVEKGFTDFEYMQKDMDAGTADDMFASILSTIPAGPDHDMFERYYNREAMLAAFERGETQQSIEHRDTRTHSWVESAYTLMENPITHKIECFSIARDINNYKLNQLGLSALIKESYDFVGIIHCHARTLQFLTDYRDRRSNRQPYPDYDNFSLGIIQEATPRFKSSDDINDILTRTRLDEVINQLEAESVLSISYQLLQNDTEQTYQLQYMYLDETHTQILVSRANVTNLLHVEHQQQEMLKQALAAAETANVAKTEFLSRMSHEIRTPMNAIIGLAALAAGDTSNPEVMEDCISKIGLSARYLLSIINDILDMSRIESGRLTLSESPFDFERLISSVNNIIYAQASEKGIDYDAIVQGFTESCYIGDNTKLQQILINILGNAVKFTPRGGKITLLIEQIDRVADRATMRFIISDTGIGIDEDYLPHLFEAFSQEEQGNTSTTVGTGLGLAISKTIANMMDGDITVRSIKGMGSEFMVDVKLGIPQESVNHLNTLTDMNLSRLSALIVDDDIIVCRSTNAILSKMGINAQWVDSGAKAIACVQTQHEVAKDFDTIFIDWKMPGMDGIETTRRIRRIVGPDVTIIIMTAYDWHTIEHVAREAGVNLFMEKPLFQSSVIKAFERIFLAKKDKITLVPETIYDLNEKRVLLVEDHPLNTEVASRLLQKQGIIVTTACNGLEAIETFAESPADYFDAILMDVRMPIMDGLTAAANIRKMHKASSQTIPIIAMTANAFEEDVNKSRKSGMDAHLAKPIEPSLLYHTLNNLINRKPEE